MKLNLFVNVWGLEGNIYNFEEDKKTGTLDLENH